MAKEDIVRCWLEIAAEDLEVAESNHSNGYWLYAAFLCHQSLKGSESILSGDARR